MKRYLFLTLLLTLSTLNINAQTTFQKLIEIPGLSTLPEICRKTTDNGYIIGGWTQIAPSNRSAFVLKIDSLANVVWSKSFDAIGNTDVTDIALTSDNGFILLCNIMENSSNITLIIRTDSIGDTLWTKSFGDLQDRIAGNSIIQTSDNGFLITGDIDNSSTANSDICVFKIDSIGNPEWSRTYGSNLSYSIDKGISSILLNDGGFMTLAHLHYGSGEVGFYLIRHDVAGNTIWSKNIATPFIINLAVYFEQTNDGGYIIAGRIKSNLNNFTFDYHLLKTDSLGNVIWSKIYSGGVSDEEPIEVHQTSDSGYVVVGNYNNPSFSYLLKLDSNGDTTWTKSYSDSSGLRVISVSEEGDGGYLLSGWVSNPQKIFLFKTDSIGTFGCYEQNHPITDSATVLQALTTPVITSSGITVNSISVIENSLLTQTSPLCFVGINENISNMKFSVYPNPVESYIYFSFEKQNVKIVSISIKNILGQIMYQEKVRDLSSRNEYKFDLSFLSNGIYLLDVIVDGEQSVHKIVKQ